MRSGTEPPRAAIYTRISKDKTGQRASVERQERECRELADRLEWQVADVYIDNDISAYSGKRRPDYERLLADIENGAINAVIAWHPDRLHRSPKELERYIDACEQHHVQNHTKQTGIWDLSTPSGRMTARVVGSAARYESEHKSERVKAAKVVNAKEGKILGGGRTWGYEVGGVVREDEAAEIRKAAEALVCGVSLRQICKGLNGRGVPTVTGKLWTSGHLGRALKRPRLAGLSVHRGVVVGTGQWTPILDAATYEAVVAILNDPARCTGGSGRRGPIPSALGTGLYVCSACGQPRMRIGRSNGRQPTYRCGGMDLPGVDDMKHMTRAAEPLDLYVASAIIRRLSHPNVIEAAVAAIEAGEAIDTKALRAEQAEIMVSMDNTAALLESATITPALVTQMTKATAELAARSEEISRELARTGTRSALRDLLGVDDIGAAWEQMEMGTRRAILSETVTVTILPARSGRMPNGSYFDDEAIDLDFKV